uniref:Uncharacterized protein n=1 Tax=Palpitomonas bilix TaxID=652834 RepID=A0A7S3GKR3_9EUKA|mmetsp:Transcript_7771/g.20210  ORF Transcript_7771/g.20210 Transcript_7771/m.20210 type:complete len:456 (+) Transcript_7771:161-1528(+)
MSARSLASPQSAGEQKKKLADSLIKKFNKKFNGPLNNPHLSSIIVAEVGKLLQKAKISPGDLEQVEAKISREAVSESSAVLRNEDVRLRKIKAEMSSKGGLPAALLSKEDRKILPKELKKTIASPKKKPAARVSVNMLENTVRARNAQLDKQKAKHTSVFSSLGMVGPATPDSDAGNILVGAKSLPLDQAVDPWSVLIMHDVKKYEDERKQREEQKRLQREQWKRELDDQVKINERKKKEAAMEEVKYAEEEQDQLRVADIQEKKKKEAKMMINTKLKEERAKTVAELQEQKRRQLEEQKEEEKSEVRRMEAEIARAERRQQRKREEEAERAKRLQEENKEQRKMREEERKKKHRMDLEYAASQARMLDDLERRRLEALGKIKEKMKTIEVMGDTLGHSILEKEEEDERRAEMWRQAYEKKQLKVCFFRVCWCRGACNVCVEAVRDRGGEMEKVN